MQRAEEPSSGSTTEPTRAPGLSPVKGFLLLGLVLAVILGAVALTTGESEQQATGEPGERTPSFTLTDAEAVERFEELNRLAIQAGHERDLSLLSVVFTSTGPTHERASREIRRLITDEVMDETRFITVKISLVTNAESEIRLLETRQLFPCFVTANGQDITKDDSVVEQEILWTLRPEDSEWRIHDGVLRNDRVLRGQHAKCP